MKIEGINGLTYFESVTLCFLLRGANTLHSNASSYGC